MADMRPSRFGRLVIATLLPLLMVAVIGGCAKKGYRTYSDVDPKGDAEKTRPEDVELFFASLDSIKPYVHVFPTGVATKAPNLDPRDFCPPDFLAQAYVEVMETSHDPDEFIRFPNRSYQILGEADADLRTPSRSRLGSGSVSEISTVPAGKNDLAPHGKPYRLPPYTYWKGTFDELRKNAAKMGADALLEVFCGQGVSSFWYPPSHYNTPIYGPNGQIVGSYAQTTPGGVGLTGWKIIGLAVRWTDESGE